MRMSAEMMRMSDDVRRLNPQIGATGRTAEHFDSKSVSADGSKDKTSQNAGKRQNRASRLMNKSEERFKEWLETGYPRALIIPQPSGFFRFPDGSSYTPDFVTVEDGRMTVWEVKGGYRGPGYDQGIERFRRARDVFGVHFGIPFNIAEWDRPGLRWQFNGI